MHQNPYFHENPVKINENPKINLPTTITIPESEAFGLVSVDPILLVRLPGFTSILTLVKASGKLWSVTRGMAEKKKREEAEAAEAKLHKKRSDVAKVNG